MLDKAECQVTEGWMFAIHCAHDSVASHVQFSVIFTLYFGIIITRKSC